jgi:hypothetical protein
MGNVPDVREPTPLRITGACPKTPEFVVSAHQQLFPPIVIQNLERQVLAMVFLPLGNRACYIFFFLVP